MLGLAAQLSSESGLREALQRGERLDAGWEPANLGNGHAGIALLHLECFRHDEESEHLTAALASLQRATAATNSTAGTRLGLLGGSAGLAFVFDLFARFEPRFSRSAERLRFRLIDAALDTKLPYDYDRFPEASADFVSGVAGLLTYLHWSGDRSLPCMHAMRALSDFLAWHFEGPSIESRLLSRPFEDVPGSDYAARHPNGVVSFGRGHGMAGLIRGMTDAYDLLGGSRLRSAIQRAADYLYAAANRPSAGGHLAIAATPDASSGHALHFDRARSLAWCSGSSGVQVSLQRAGLALNDPDIVAAAEKFHALAHHHDPLPSGLCHGREGIDLAAALFQRRSGEQALSSGASGSPREDDADAIARNAPTFLEGTVGVALSNVARHEHVEPHWVQIIF